MSDYLNAYMGTVTKDGVDGDLISENEKQTNPLSFVLNAKNNEAKAVKIAIRCAAGYKTSGDTTISAVYWDGTKYAETGGNVGKWKFAVDNNFADEAAAVTGATWLDVLKISDVIAGKNVIVWVKASSDSTEKPQKDTAVAINIKGFVEASA